MYIFLYLYLFTSTWNSIFAFSYFSIPYLFFTLYVSSSLLKPKLRLNKKIILYVIFPFFFSVLYYFIFAIINIGSGQKVFNFAFAYVFFPLLSCYLPLSFSLDEKRAKNVRKYFFNGLTFVALILIVESLIRTLSGIDIISYLPTIKDNLGCSTTESLDLICRARAFSSEPIIAGIPMSIGLNYSLISLKNKYINLKRFSLDYAIKYLFLIILFIWAIISTGSSAAFVAAVIPLLIFSLIKIFNWFLLIFKGKFNIKGFNGFLIGIVFLFLILLTLQKFIPGGDELFSNLLAKIFLDDRFSSVNSRIAALFEFYDSFLDDPIGLKGFVGSISGVQEGSAINWYITILGDSGLLGFAFTLGPVFLASKMAISSSGISDLNKLDKFILILTPIVGLFFSATFYSSLIWPLIIVVYFL